MCRKYYEGNYFLPHQPAATHHIAASFEVDDLVWCQSDLTTAGNSLAFSDVSCHCSALSWQQSLAVTTTKPFISCRPSTMCSAVETLEQILTNTAGRWFAPVTKIQMKPENTAKDNT